MGRIPFTAFTSPFKLISPIIILFSSASWGTSPNAARTAMAIGRSNPDPVFLIFAGIKLMVIRFAGSRMPLFFNAVRTRSFDSFTSDARNPTISNTGIPLLTSASTYTGVLLIPCIIDVVTKLYNSISSLFASGDAAGNPASDCYKIR